MGQTEPWSRFKCTNSGLRDTLVQKQQCALGYTFYFSSENFAPQPSGYTAGSRPFCRPATKLVPCVAAPKLTVSFTAAAAVFLKALCMLFQNFLLHWGRSKPRLCNLMVVLVSQLYCYIEVFLLHVQKTIVEILLYVYTIFFIGEFQLCSVAAKIGRP